MVIEESTLEAIAFKMFCRNMKDYEFDEGTEHLEWAGDPGIVQFWIAQAKGVIDDIRELTGYAHA